MDLHDALDTYVGYAVTADILQTTEIEIAFDARDFIARALSSGQSLTVEERDMLAEADAIYAAHAVTIALVFEYLGAEWFEDRPSDHWAKGFLASH